MLHSLLSQIAFLVMLATCTLSVVKGGVVERWAAGIVSASWLVSFGLSLFFAGRFSRQIEEFVFLTVDAATAMGLLALALRFAKMWLGLAMLMQSGELALHGAIMADWGIPFRQYMVLNNLLSFGLLGLLLGATITAWVQRSRVKVQPCRQQTAEVSIEPTLVAR